MVVETKFNIGQTVYFLQNSRAVAGTVHSVETYTMGEKGSRVQYYIRTDEGLVVEPYLESILFFNREELLNSL